MKNGVLCVKEEISGKINLSSGGCVVLCVCVYLFFTFGVCSSEKKKPIEVPCGLVVEMGRSGVL